MSQQAHENEPTRDLDSQDERSARQNPHQCTWHLKVTGTGASVHIPAPRIRTNGRPRGRENFGDSVKFSGMTQLYVDESKESHGVTSKKWADIW